MALEIRERVDITSNIKHDIQCIKFDANKVLPLVYSSLASKAKLL